MNRRRGSLVLVVAWCALGRSTEPLSAQEPPRSYFVNFAATAPTIDGQVSSESEWSAADPSGDEWTTFPFGSPDPLANSFAALWDNNGLYLQQQVHYSGWQSRGQQWDLTYDNLNFFFDPNVDGEPNENTQVFGTSTDGYHLAINQPLGESGISPSSANVGLEADYYVNANYGAAGTWKPEIKLQQVTSVENATGYLEMFIPWSAFNKTDPSAPGIDPTRDEVGLFHTQPVTDGEEWFFNLIRYVPASVSPAWSLNTSGLSASDRPHGVLKFVGTALDPCDLNGDGACNADDIDSLSRAILSADNAPRFDVNQDGTLDDLDRLFYVEDTLNTWIGDADLDGMFDTTDFVSVFILGGYEDGLPGNAGWASGDWDGDLDFTTSDFVAAFIAGGFEAGPRPAAAVAAVPEPSAGILAALAATLTAHWSRKRRRQ